MAEQDPDSPDLPGSTGSLRVAPLLASALVAIAVGLVPFASLRALGAPLWLAVGAVLALFPVLPALWHLSAERSRRAATVPSAGSPRFALRALAIALLVLGVAFSMRGPSGIRALLTELLRRAPTTAAAPAVPKVVPLPAGAPKGLDTFVPADATVAVASAGSAAMRQLLADQGADTSDKLAALGKCKIDIEKAHLLIAGRGGGTRMVVLRAPGITDERNLYCLVGVMGSERMQIRFLGKDPGSPFEVTGIGARPLTFRPVETDTIAATDQSWLGTAGKTLITSKGAEGRLATAMARIDRAAALWAVSLVETAAGPWDLALDGHFADGRLQLRASSTAPSGAAEKVQMSLTLPLAVAAALPKGALAGGVTGLVTMLFRSGASVPDAAAAPAAPAVPAP